MGMTFFVIIKFDKLGMQAFRCLLRSTVYDVARCTIHAVVLTVVLTSAVVAIRQAECCPRWHSCRH